jgi:predicted RNase H-related nuclease YkuK (DUF458 family)
MARLKIGSGIKMESQALQVEEYRDRLIPVEIPSIEQIVEFVRASIPKQEVPVQKEVDLSHLATKEEMQHAVIELCAQRDITNNRIDSISSLLDKISHEPAIIVPEVKHVTHVKDVSKEVYQEIDSVRKQLTDAHIHIAEHQLKLQEQKRINYILSGLAALTILLHFI